jgi:hypothetical protein
MGIVSILNLQMFIYNLLVLPVSSVKNGAAQEKERAR